jgi:hypothetical protein
MEQDMYGSTLTYEREHSLNKRNESTLPQNTTQASKTNNTTKTGTNKTTTTTLKNPPTLQTLQTLQTPKAPKAPKAPKVPKAPTIPPSQKFRQRRSFTRGKGARRRKAVGLPWQSNGQIKAIGATTVNTYWLAINMKYLFSLHESTIITPNSRSWSGIAVAFAHVATWIAALLVALLGTHEHILDYKTGDKTQNKMARDISLAYVIVIPLLVVIIVVHARSAASVDVVYSSLMSVLLFFMIGIENLIGASLLGISLCGEVKLYRWVLTSNALTAIASCTVVSFYTTWSTKSLPSPEVVLTNRRLLLGNPVDTRESD